MKLLDPILAKFLEDAIDNEKTRYETLKIAHDYVMELPNFSNKYYDKDFLVYIISYIIKHEVSITKDKKVKKTKVQLVQFDPSIVRQETIKNIATGKIKGTGSIDLKIGKEVSKARRAFLKENPPKTSITTTVTYIFAGRYIGREAAKTLDDLIIKIAYNLEEYYHSFYKGI